MLVSRSTYYYWLKRTQTYREQVSGILLTEARRIHRGAETVGESARTHSELMASEIHDPDTQAARRQMLRLRDLNPVLRLTAAMEAAGVDEQGFGFILRYGRYAPEGRRSDFIVGGLGLAELSKRIVAWLDGQAPMDAQVQIVDDGSGELVVYLLKK